MSLANASETLQNTTSVGYTFSHINNYGNIHDVNFSYRYEFTPEWGAGVTLVDRGNRALRFGGWGLSRHDSKMNYPPLLAGPIYQINDFVSIDGKIGAAYIKPHGSES
ncbi:TPA: hypothetical protein NM844_000909 [Salmonella enterica]|nr:hypothetical protein [Salmonella enterica]